MRNCRLIPFLVLLVACKAATVTSSYVKIEEDLSKYRPVYESLEENEESEQEVEIEQEVGDLKYAITEEIDSINQLIIERNKGKQFTDGYTIQVYSGTSREEAEKARRTANVIFPELDSDLIYVQPTYRVKIGEFMDRMEASSFYSEVKDEFPRAILIPKEVALFKIDSDDNDR